MTNTYSRSYRSVRQCKTRYELKLMPNEDNKPVPETPTKKLSRKHKSSSFGKTTQVRKNKTFYTFMYKSLISFMLKIAVDYKPLILIFTINFFLAFLFF